MKYLNEKKLPLIIIAVSLLFLFQSRTANRNDAIVEDDYSENTPQYVADSPLRFNERVIYTCRLADEEIPAVRISEVTDQNGRVIETVTHAPVGTGLEREIHGAGASWNYKSLSVNSGDDVIDIAYAPDAGRADYDWVLSISDNESVFRERVRDCMEVSDE